MQKTELEIKWQEMINSNHQNFMSWIHTLAEPEIDLISSWMDQREAEVLPKIKERMLDFQNFTKYNNQDVLAWQRGLDMIETRCLLNLKEDPSFQKEERMQRLYWINKERQKQKLAPLNINDLKSLEQSEKALESLIHFENRKKLQNYQELKGFKTKEILGCLDDGVEEINNSNNNSMVMVLKIPEIEVLEIINIISELCAQEVITMVDVAYKEMNYKDLALFIMPSSEVDSLDLEIKHYQDFTAQNIKSKTQSAIKKFNKLLELE